MRVATANAPISPDRHGREDESWKLECRARGCAVERFVSAFGLIGRTHSWHGFSRESSYHRPSRGSTRFPSGADPEPTEHPSHQSTQSAMGVSSRSAADRAVSSWDQRASSAASTRLEDERFALDHQHGGFANGSPYVADGALTNKVRHR